MSPTEFASKRTDLPARPIPGTPWEYVAVAIMPTSGNETLRAYVLAESDPETGHYLIGLWAGDDWQHIVQTDDWPEWAGEPEPPVRTTH